MDSKLKRYLQLNCLTQLFQSNVLLDRNALSVHEWDSLCLYIIVPFKPCRIDLHYIVFNIDSLPAPRWFRSILNGLNAAEPTIRCP